MAPFRRESRAFVPFSPFCSVVGSWLYTRDWTAFFFGTGSPAVVSRGRASAGGQGPLGVRWTSVITAVCASMCGPRSRARWGCCTSMSRGKSKTRIDLLVNKENEATWTQRLQPLCSRRCKAARKCPAWRSAQMTPNWKMVVAIFSDRQWFIPDKT